MVTARTVVRFPDSQKWRLGECAAVNCRPFDLHKAKEPTVIFQERTDGEALLPPGGPRNVRKLYIKKADIDAYGFTSGCPKCDMHMRYGHGRTTKGHSEQCRQIIATKLAETPAGRERIRAAEGRMDEAVAEAVPAQGEIEVVPRTQLLAFEKTPDGQRERSLDDPTTTTAEPRQPEEHRQPAMGETMEATDMGGECPEL